MSGCEEVREILVAVARGEVVSAPGERFLREHAETCPQCRGRLANEQMLSKGLAAVASAAGSPPPALKAALLTEFRRQQVVTPIRRPAVKWVVMTAVAAALLMAVFLAKTRRPDRAVPPVQIPVAAVSAPVPPPVLTAGNKTAVPVKTRPVRRTRAVKPAPKPEAETAEVATDFFQIPYTEPLRPEQRADVFRIQMPRAGMAAFGLPVSGGRLDSRITADVLMGEDGVARAIRFIR